MVSFNLFSSIGSLNIEVVADAIQRNHGSVTGACGSGPGWSKWEVRPPLNGETTWGHMICLTGYGQNDKGKYVEFMNSWSEYWGGNKGRGRIYEDYFKSGNMFAIWTLVDKENLNKSMIIDTIKLADKPEIYMKSKTDNKAYWIATWPTYQRFLQAGWCKEVVVVPSLAGLEIVSKPFGWIE